MDVAISGGGAPRAAGAALSWRGDNVSGSVRARGRSPRTLVDYGWPGRPSWRQEGAGWIGGGSLIVVTSHTGFHSAAELERLAAKGELARKDYVELAGALDADILDADYMERRASRTARAIGQRWGFRPVSSRRPFSVEDGT